MASTTRDSSAPRAGARAAYGPAPVVDVAQMPLVLRRIALLALRHRWRMGLAVGCSLGAAVAGLTLPGLFGGAVDEAQALLTGGPAQAEKAVRALWVTAGLVVAASALRGGLTAAAGHLGEYVSQQVARELRLRFFDKLQKLSFGFHDRIHSGDLITRGMLDLEGARVFIQNGMMQALSVVTLLGFAAYMMLSTDLVMGLIGVAFVPVAGVALARMGFLLRVAWLRIQELMAVLTLTMEESLQGIRVVRAFAGKPFEMAKFDRAAGDVLQHAYRRIMLRGRGVSVMTIAFYASMAGLLWYGGRKVIAGTMSAGELTAFLTYMTIQQAPIRQVAMIFNAAARATSAGGRLFEVLDLDPEIADSPSARPLAPTQGRLRFDRVSFAYPGGGPVLSDVSFEVGPGQTLGVVGAPGSGKSTIANLAPRFYDVSAGAITIDGQDIRDVTLGSLREYVGVVQQEAFLFDSSVGHNIAYADPWADDGRIAEAARTAHIDDHVASLPAGYETRVGERGVALSGGQRQRMNIARGILPEPGVIIFDDSAAAIDAVTEQRVRAALAAATRAKATIIIAHRLSSLMHADEILVLDTGRVVERGSHAQLLAQGGIYSELYALQTRSETPAAQPQREREETLA